MAQNNDIHGELRQLVEQAVAKALQAQLPHMQSQIAHHVLEALPAQASTTSAQAGSDAADAASLAAAVSNIHTGSTQKEILRALLDAGSGHCSRIALFVVKAGAALGWQSRGFADDERSKDFALDLSAPPVANAYHTRTATQASLADMGAAFAEHFGHPANERVLILPLALKDKVAALVYADGGESGKLDANALQLLVIATSAWLEVISLRKQAAKEDGSRPETVPVQTVSSFSDPFVAHAPMHSAHRSSAAAEAQAAAAAASAGAGVAPAADVLAGLSPEDAEVHRKAQRFARLLVDEIKLYNQAKVAEGRRNKDLYDRLKDDIEKSRGTFQKRYGHTAAAAANYLEHELVRSLAEDDVSTLGANFRSPV